MLRQPVPGGPGRRRRPRTARLRRRVGGRGARRPRAAGPPVEVALPAAYVEAHIEQGPILASAGAAARRRRRDRRDRRLRPDVPRRVRPCGNGADGGSQRRLLGVRRARVAPARARARDPGLGRDDRRRLGREPCGERHPRCRPRDGRRPRPEPRGPRRHRRRRARPGLLRRRPARMQRRRHPRLALRAGPALQPRPRRRPRSGGRARGPDRRARLGRRPRRRCPCGCRGRRRDALRAEPERRGEPPPATSSPTRPTSPRRSRFSPRR